MRATWISPIVLVVGVCGAVGQSAQHDSGAAANPCSPQSGFSASVIEHGRTEDGWSVSILLLNTSRRSCRVPLAFTLRDVSGAIHLLESGGSAGMAPFILDPSGALPEFQMQFHDGKLVSGGLTLEPTAPPGRPVILDTRFLLPKECQPVQIALSPAGRGIDLSKAPALPLLSPPKIWLGNQPPGMLMAIGRIARARPRSPGLHAQLTPALAATDDSWPSSAKTTVTFRSDRLSISSDDTFVAVSVTFENKGSLPVDVAVGDIRLYGRWEDECAPFGMAQGPESIEVGTPFNEKLLIAPKARRRATLIYRPRHFWTEEYTLTWAGTQAAPKTEVR
jgi:hypothetical protein